MDLSHGDVVTNAAGAQAYVLGIIPDKENRERDDFYPTPPSGTNALLNVETFEGDIWEPACGDGAISKVLTERGHEVRSTDLIDRGYGEAGVDFLLDFSQTADNIITNPPFKLAEEFVSHALGRARRKVAMLMRLAWLEGEKRRRLFQSTPLARVHVFSRRLSMARGGEQREDGAGGMIAFAWFVWDHEHTGSPTLNWINPA